LVRRLRTLVAVLILVWVGRPWWLALGSGLALVGTAWQWRRVLVAVLALVWLLLARVAVLALVWIARHRRRALAALPWPAG